MKIMFYFSTVLILCTLLYADINEDLINEIRKGDFLKVKELIARGADINAKIGIYCENTPLHIAAVSGDLKIVKYLVSKGANITPRNCISPLYYALGYSNSEKIADIANYLISKGAIFNTKDKPLIAMLSHATEFCRLYNVKFLLSTKEMHPYPSLLSDAARGGCLKTIKFLFSKGLGKNPKDDNISEALYTAVAHRQANIIRYLLLKGADPNYINHSELREPYDTPLLIAVWNNRLDIVKLLIEHGAKIDYKNSDGVTALMLAAGKGYYSIFKYLISKGASLHTIDNAGNSILHWAVTCGSFGYIGDYAFDEVECHENLRIVKTLLSMGVDINAKNNHGVSPLAMAKTQFCRIVNYLIVLTPPFLHT